MGKMGEGGRWGKRGEKRRDERWTNKKMRMGIGIRGLEGSWERKGRGKMGWVVSGQEAKQEPNWLIGL